MRSIPSLSIYDRNLDKSAELNHAAGLEGSILTRAEVRTFGAQLLLMQLDVASDDRLFALIANDGLERADGIMRLEISAVDPELARPVTSILLLTALDLEPPHHSLHKSVGQQAVRKAAATLGADGCMKFVYARGAHDVTCRRKTNKEE